MKEFILYDDPERRKKGFTVKPVKYVIDNNTGCWNVSSHSRYGGKGYPAILINRKYWSIHRLSFFIHKGPIPSDKVVRHTCDNKICCNPDHLILGSNYDNSKDAVIRNRIKTIFSPEQLDFIIKNDGLSDKTKAEILSDEGTPCSREHIRNIRLNRSLGEKRNTVLSAEERLAIKRDPRTKREIAKDYRVSTMTVYRIKKGV